MVNVPDLDQARPAQWLAASTDWQDLGTDLGRVADQVDSEVTGVVSRGAWSGSAATAAHSRMQDAVNALEAAHGEVNAVSDVLEGLGQAISVCQRAMAEAHQMASRYGLTIHADGTVSHQGNLLERAADDVVGWVEGSPRIAEVQDLVAQTLHRATQADEEAAAELRKIASHAGLADPVQTYGDNTHSNADGLTASRLELQMIYQSIPTGPPSVVSQWWASLPPGQQATLMEAAPGTLGTLHGIPANVQAQLQGNDGINRVTLINYALNNTFSNSDDVDVDNCTNFVSDGLLAAGLHEIGHFPEDRSSIDNWYKSDTPVTQNTPLSGSGNYVAGRTRSQTWGDASDLHAFLTHNGSKEVPYSQAQPGDIVFYKDPSEGIYHSTVITAKINGQIFYSQHTPGEQNASWGSRQTMPGITNPHDPTSVIIVRPGQDHPPLPQPQPGATPSPSAPRPSPPGLAPSPQANQAP